MWENDWFTTSASSKRVHVDQQQQSRSILPSPDPKRDLSDSRRWLRHSWLFHFFFSSLHEPYHRFLSSRYFFKIYSSWIKQFRRDDTINLQLNVFATLHRGRQTASDFHTPKSSKRATKTFSCTEKTGSFCRSRARSSPRLNRLCIKHFGKLKKKVKQATISEQSLRQYTRSTELYFYMFLPAKSILLPFFTLILYFSVFQPNSRATAESAVSSLLSIESCSGGFFSVVRALYADFYRFHDLSLVHDGNLIGDRGEELKRNEKIKNEKLMKIWISREYIVSPRESFFGD